MFPYKIQVMQKLEDSNYTTCTVFANCYLQTIQMDGSFISQTTYSFKCVFHADRNVNKHNLKVRGTERSQDRRKRARGSIKVTFC